MNQALIVIPCYRESARLEPFLLDLAETLQGENARILVVEDGSSPDEAQKTRDIVDRVRNPFPHVSPMLALPQNAGKGGAVYQGWDQATAEETLLGFVDADGASPAYEVKAILQQARKDGEQIAYIASRIKMLGKKIHRIPSRHYLGRIFATMVSELLDIPVYDSQCGLKIVPKNAYLTIRPVLVTHHFAFDVELLAALLDCGTKIREFPIDWSEIPGGKVKFLSDPIKMFREVLKVRQRRKHWHFGS